MSIGTRKARKLRAYVTRKIRMKRELDAYLAESYAAEAAWEAFMVKLKGGGGFHDPEVWDRLDAYYGSNPDHGHVD